MPQSYQDILNEILPLFHRDEERFLRFYRSVNNILASIPEGRSIRIEQYCKAQHVPLFRKIATLYIIEQRKYQQDDFESHLEFYDDNEIRHVPKYVFPPTAQIPLFLKQNKKLKQE